MTEPSMFFLGVGLPDRTQLKLVLRFQRKGLLVLDLR